MKIAVVDDSASDRELLTSYINGISRELNCETAVSAHASGEGFLENEDFSALDAVFMDIYLGEKSGLEIAEVLRSKDYHGLIIFCTTTSAFAIAGYSVGAVGYIVKPFTYEVIASQLKRILKTLGETKRSIRVKDGRQWCKVSLADIFYAEKQGNYVRVHTFGKIYSIRMALGELEEQLLRYNCFAKCDRGILVNLENIKKMQDDTILLKSGERIPISRSNKALINDRYFDFIFKKME